MLGLRRSLSMSSEPGRRNTKSSKHEHSSQRILWNLCLRSCYWWDTHRRTSHPNAAERTRQWSKLFDLYLHRAPSYCSRYQEYLLSVTNTFEGTIFVNENISSTSPLSNYVGQLFPTLSSGQVSAAVEQYTNIGLDGTFNQAVGIMGECECDMVCWIRKQFTVLVPAIFICPTYKLLAAFPGRSHKVCQVQCHLSSSFEDANRESSLYRQDNMVRMCRTTFTSKHQILSLVEHCLSLSLVILRRGISIIPLSSPRFHNHS